MREKHDSTFMATKHPLYKVWVGMKERCNSPKFKQYHNYGGRGITVCKQWEERFRNFLYWAIKRGYQKGLELDRIDNDKGYSPENCRWATHSQNNRNKTNNRYALYRGENRLLIELCEEHSIHFKTVCNRLDRAKWDIEKALTFPVLVRKKPETKKTNE